MSRKSLYILGILATIVVGTYLYLNLCSICMGDLNQERSIEIVGAQSKFQAPSPSYPFTLDEGEFSLNVDDNFNFYVSSPSFLMPISPKLKVGLKDLENHLTDHKDQTLTIIGHHSSKEEKQYSL